MSHIGTKRTYRLYCAMSALRVQSGKHILALRFSGFDPQRSSATSKDTWLDRARRLPSVEFGQSHCPILMAGTGMRRREFIGLVSGAAVWPLAARTQPKLPIIGFLGLGLSPNFEAVRNGLAEGGFIEGRDYTFEYRVGVAMQRSREPIICHRGIFGRSFRALPLCLASAPYSSCRQLSSALNTVPGTLTRSSQ
jgi:hypothetical protein